MKQGLIVFFVYASLLFCFWPVQVDRPTAKTYSYGIDKKIRMIYYCLSIDQEIPIPEMEKTNFQIESNLSKSRERSMDKYGYYSPLTD